MEIWTYNHVKACINALSGKWKNLRTGEIEEATIEAFLRYEENEIENIVQDGEDAIKAWIIRAANNYLIDEKRKWHSRRESLVHANPNTGKESTGWLDEKFKCEIESQISCDLYKEAALKILPKKYHPVFNLIESKNKEIAEDLGISLSTIKRHRAKIRNILKKELPPPKLIFSEA